MVLEKLKLAAEGVPDVKTKFTINLRYNELKNIIFDDSRHVVADKKIARSKM